MVGVAGDQGDGDGGFAEDHLFEDGFNFSPTVRFLEGAAGESSVANVGDGDLDGVFVHGGFVADDFGGDHDVLGEVFGDSAADHQKAGDAVLDFDLGQFVKVLDAVERDFGAIAAAVLVGDEAETSGTVAEGGDEDGDVFFVSFAK